MNITEAELAKIDEANDEYRRIAEIMIAGGWTLTDVRAAHRAAHGGPQGCGCC